MRLGMWSCPLGVDSGDPRDVSIIIKQTRKLVYYRTVPYEIAPPPKNGGLGVDMVGAKRAGWEMGCFVCSFLGVFDAPICNYLFIMLYLLINWIDNNYSRLKYIFSTCKLPLAYYVFSFALIFMHPFLTFNS